MLPEPTWTPTTATLTESNAARWMGVCLRRLTDGSYVAVASVPVAEASSRS